ncbi:hypothetical protein FA13DRAFT_1778093 [Coprinellus micaceus]|uniref:F-box domain-containing protein n=1 Tax=Coprinellus micaceus TaxID=71717 RepID=A0A4Y7SQ30_COPMI|nr:hypothetical protein FA13DRAFT_1778093 [Coprinellus micaceus]
MSTSIKPELTMELITIVVHHTQDLEDGELLPSPFSNTRNQEAASDTLARIRRLLKKGLVSKTWHGAILDPRLWTTFLNANLCEDQFLRVVSCSGDLPVSIRFKAPPVIDADTPCETVSEKTVEAILTKLPQAEDLAIDLAEAQAETHREEMAKWMRLLERPVPNLHTLSLTGPTGRPLDLTSSPTSPPLFGRETPEVQHLYIMDIIIPPRTFAHLSSLSIGLKDVRLLADVIPPWIHLVKQGGIAGLRELEICGPILSRDTELFDPPWHPWWHDFDPIEVPPTIERFKIMGSAAACGYIADVISIPMTTSFMIEAICHSRCLEGSASSLTDYVTRQWGRVLCSEISLLFRPDTISWTLVSATRSATLTHTSSSPPVYQPMINAVYSNLNPLSILLDAPKPRRLTYRNRLEPLASDSTWLVLDVVVAGEDLQIQPGCLRPCQAPIYLGQLLESLKTIRSLNLKRYDIEWRSSGEPHAWCDAVGLFQYQGDVRGYALPGLQRIQLSQPRGGPGMTEKLQRAVMLYARERDLAVRVIPGV